MWLIYWDYRFDFLFAKVNQWNNGWRNKRNELCKRKVYYDIWIVNRVAGSVLHLLNWIPNYLPVIRFHMHLFCRNSLSVRRLFLLFSSRPLSLSYSLALRFIYFHWYSLSICNVADISLEVILISCNTYSNLFGPIVWKSSEWM